MDWETPLPSSKMYHAAPAPGGGSSANPPVLEARLAPDPETRVSRLPPGGGEGPVASRGSEGNIFNTPVVSQPRAYDRAQLSLHEEHRQPSVAAPRDRGRVFWG